MARRPETIVPVVVATDGADPIRRDKTQGSEADTKITPRLEARRVLGESETGVFVWPFERPMAATIVRRIPSDLLN
jgi:hypothetical protein